MLEQELVRTYGEVLAMARFEPTLKNVFVEGISDRLFLADFLSRQNITDVAIYYIDQVDFSEVFDKLDGEEAEKLKKSNKEKVIFLGKSLEDLYDNQELSCLCVVDIDWDMVFGKERRGKYLSYTDFNSMELYLFEERCVSDFFRKGIRVTGEYKVPDLLKSMAEAGRWLFHCHAVSQLFNRAPVRYDKNLSFDKKSWTCSFDINGYWSKLMNDCQSATRSKELREEVDKRMGNECDPRSEIRGHDFIHLLYLWTKAKKSHLEMCEEEFSNFLWAYANWDTLSTQPLFKRVSSL